jgi:superfamily II DNA/RNA helicase
MGFIDDIEKIVSRLPPRRQTMLFSATMDNQIERLTKKFLKDPVHVQVSRAASTADTIDQKLVRVPSKPDEKRAALRARIDASVGLTNAIIFCNRKRDVATLARSLQRHGYSAGALHGDMDQKSRMETLDAFKTNKLTLLVASDVAARGLDIPAVSHVFNFDVPVHAEDYVHRIGRTGRAGRSGVAYTFVGPSDSKHLDSILKLIQKPIDWLEGDKPKPEAESDVSSPDADKPSRGRRGRAAAKPRTESGTRAQAEAEAALETPVETKDKAEPAPKSTRKRAPKRTETPPDDSPFGDAGPIPAFLLRPARISQ